MAIVKHYVCIPRMYELGGKKSFRNVCIDAFPRNNVKKVENCGSIPYICKKTKSADFYDVYKVINATHQDFYSAMSMWKLSCDFDQIQIFTTNVNIAHILSICSFWSLWPGINSGTIKEIPCSYNPDTNKLCNIIQKMSRLNSTATCYPNEEIFQIWTKWSKFLSEMYHAEYVARTSQIVIEPNSDSSAHERNEVSRKILYDMSPYWEQFYREHSLYLDRVVTFYE